MASKPKKNAAPQSPPDLPAVLSKARERAVAGSSPEPSQEDSEAVPILLDLLTPRMIEKIDYNGQGTAPRVLREPMVMLSWDRLAGRWKWGISDKSLNLSGVAYCGSLATAISDLEAALRDDRVAWKERKVT